MMHEPGRPDPLKYAITLALVIAAIFILPPVRAITLFLLPMGTGIDDLIAWGALDGAAALVALSYIGKLNLAYQKRRAVFVFILVTALVSAVLISVVSS